jgi:hypothetical protein
MLGQINFTPYSAPYIGSANKELSDAIGSRLNLYNTAIEADDILSQQVDTFSNSITPFQNDRIYAMQLMDEARQDISSRAKNGDYENALRGIKNTARNFSSKAQPLLQNKALYDSYKKELDERLKQGKISQTTYNDALRKSVDGYQGLSLDNPNDTTSLFRGFSPSDDVELNKELSDYYKGWKADGGSRQIIDNNTGLIKTITWEEAQKGATIGGKYYSGQDIMKMAGQRYLMSNPKVKDYYNTQAQLRPGRFESELDNALLSTTEAAYFNNIKENSDFLPDYVFERLGLNQYVQNPNSAPSSITKNIFNKDALEGMELKPDGTVNASTQMYEYTNGTYYKYVDKNGNQLDINKGKQLFNDQFKGTFGNMTSGINIRNLVDKIPLSKDELNKVVKQNQTIANDLLLQDLTISPQGRALLGSLHTDYENLTPAQQLNYASDMLAKGKIPIEYKNQFFNRYKNSVKNNVQVSTSQWLKKNVTDYKLLGGSAITDTGVIANGLQGRSIAVANKDKEINDIVQQGFQEDGGSTDINSILKAVGDNGWEIKSLVENGILKVNPLMDAPGTSMTMTISHPDKGTRQLNLVASLTDQDQVPVLNIIQQVGKLSLNSQGGKVNVGNNVNLLVRNSPTGLPEGQPQFFTTVSEIKSDGNVGNTWALDEFQDYMLTTFGKSEAARFLGNKSSR